MKRNYNLEIMNELVKRGSLRSAVKLLDKPLSGERTLAQLMKSGNSKKALTLLRLSL